MTQPETLAKCPNRMGNPAPFCEQWTPIIVKDSHWFQVKCDACGSRGPYADSEQEAVSRWNALCSPDKPEAEAAESLTMDALKEMHAAFLKRDGQTKMGCLNTAYELEAVMHQLKKELAPLPSDPSVMEMLTHDYSKDGPKPAPSDKLRLELKELRNRMGNISGAHLGPGGQYEQAYESGAKAAAQLLDNFIVKHASALLSQEPSSGEAQGPERAQGEVYAVPHNPPDVPEVLAPVYRFLIGRCLYWKLLIGDDAELPKAPWYGIVQIQIKRSGKLEYCEAKYEAPVFGGPPQWSSWNASEGNYDVLKWLKNWDLPIGVSASPVTGGDSTASGKDSNRKHTK